MRKLQARMQTTARKIYCSLWKNRSRWQRVGMVVTLIFLVAAVGLWRWLFAGMPSLDALDEGMALPSTRIYDRHGVLLYEIVDLYGGSHQTITLDEMSGCLPAATIATEDANFYDHPGVDVQGVARALWTNVRGGEVRAGGSTITQQVARNLLLTKNPVLDRSLRRKAQEAVLALQLHQRYSRDEILALYLNQTYYGNLAYGVGAATQAYFGKSPSALSLAECAMLAGLPQAPGLYNPLVNPELAKQRQEIVLDLMVRHGHISEREAEQAKNEQLHYSSAQFAIQAPHFVFAVWTQVERNYGDELLLGGLEIHTTLDLNWQNAAERIMNRHLDYLNDPTDGLPPRNVRNAALVALDPLTGEIRAMLGSPDYFDEGIDGNVNAALAPRQPGSALKPFTFAAAFDPTRDNPWTPATMVMDVETPFVTRRLESYTPANFGLVEHGPVLVREALASSYNIPSVIALDAIGIEALVGLTSRLGISTLTDVSRFDLSLTLGGGEVRLVDLVGAYSAFPNGGQRVDPVYIQRVERQSGEVLYEWEPPQPGTPELDPRVAFLINSILSDPYARIPSFGTNSALDIGRIAGAKTGTTTDFRDNWTVGYTPTLVTGVWVGNADNTPMIDVTGISGAGPIWNEFMRTVLYGTPVYDFAVPPGVERHQVCITSGLLPTEHCPKRIWEWFIAGTEPNTYDTFYQPFEIDTRTGQLATNDTPDDFRETEVFLVLPPEARDWAARNGLPVPPIGAVQVQGQQEEHKVRLLSPDPYTTFQLSPLIPSIFQRVRLDVIAPPQTTAVRYWLNDELLTTVESAPFDYWWSLQPGQFTLRAEIVQEDGTRVTSEGIPFRVRSYSISQQQAAVLHGE
jgi:penicillin-binding protein 1C